MELYNNQSLDSGKVVLKFGATWCMPCNRLAKILEKIHEEFSDVKFYSVDIDDYPELARKFNIRSVPTVINLSDNNEIERIVGLLPLDVFRSAFRRL